MVLWGPNVDEDPLKGVPYDLLAGTLGVWNQGSYSCWGTLFKIPQYGYIVHNMVLELWISYHNMGI